MSSLFLRTLRDDPADAEVPSHRLLVRAGYVRRVAPGVFSWLPLGYLTYRNIENIIRAEMDRAGFQEVHFPALLPREPYERTNRWDEYGDTLQDAMLFLAGKDRELLGRLERRMGELADAERYEDAIRVRDLIATLRSSLSQQSVVDVRLGDRDVWALFREGDRGAVAVLPVRAGHMQQPAVSIFAGEIASDEELLSTFVNDWYDAEIPPEILLPTELPDQAALQDLLTERRKAKVTLAVPKRGEKVRVLEIAEQAAKARFETTHSQDERIAHALDALAEIAGLEVPPYRIECYDNSNLLGQEPVASQVVFIEGRPARAEYRRYKVKTVVDRKSTRLNSSHSSVSRMPSSA